MRRVLFCFVCLLMWVPVALAQKASVGDPQSDKRSHLVISEGEIKQLHTAPIFKKKGFEKYWKWVLANLQYPPEMEAKKIAGTVMVKIIIENDGVVSVAEVQSSPNQMLTDEVLRVIKISPRWTPATLLDPATSEVIPVRVSYILPVEFKVRPPSLDSSVTGKWTEKSNFRAYGS